MNIINLKTIPQHIPVLARWHHEQWSYLNPGYSLEARTAEMQHYLGEASIPAMYVAIDNYNLLGSAAIIASDMDTRPELTPWLANMFVNPDYRKMGIGLALVQHVVAEARQQGLARLYLFTPDQEAFYAKLGWYTLFKEPYRGDTVTIMQIDLASVT